jgi:hypothetical protein
LIAEGEGDHATAARSFELAGSKLTGDEAARAYLHAGDAYTAAGNTTLASSMYKRASSMVTGDAGLAAAIRERQNAPAATSGGRFSLPVPRLALTRSSSARSRIVPTRRSSPRPLRTWDLVRPGS